MKQFCFCIYFGLFTSALAAQTYRPDVVEYFNSEWQPVTRPKKAVYITVFKKRNDSCWTKAYYNAAGPMIRMESFSDSTAGIKHGNCNWYDEYGYLDSTHKYENGYFTGSFYHTRKGAGKNRFDAPPPPPAAPDANTKEAVFKEGSFSRWISYNMSYPMRTADLKISGQMLISFVVDTAGLVTHMELLKSLEYAADEMFLRLINRSSGKWIPGIVEGRPVKSYHEQPANLLYQ